MACPHIQNTKTYGNINREASEKLSAWSQAPQLFYTTCRPFPVKLEQYEADLNEEDACHLHKQSSDWRK